MPFPTHDEYFATLSPEVRELLEQVRAEVEKRIPGATRCISYNMPAFRERRTFMYIAAFKKHIGVYPPLNENLALVEETARYRGPKGNLSFPFNEPLPLDLIGRVAVALDAQYSKR